MVIDGDGRQLMWMKHGERDGCVTREWDAFVITEEMIEAGARRLGETWNDNLMPGEAARAVLRAALQSTEAPCAD